MYDRLLVPTDGSEVAEAAADAAITLAKRFDADLHVLHVHELGDLPPDFEDEDADEFAHRGEAAASAVADRAADAGITATARIVRDGGPIHRSILQYAADHDVDCLVMGTYGRTGLDRFVLGSVAERTIRAASIPVMTVHEETVVDEDFDSALVPTDGSDCSLAAADHAIDLVSATGGTFHCIHVVDYDMVMENGNAGMVLDALEQAGKEALDLVVERAEAASLSTIEATVLNGTPYRVIAEYAEEEDVDCIVMGTHGRTGLDRFLLGSVTERVVRLTDVPVLTIHEPKESE